jgi:glyoxylase-like metal-dependent hydrolase (beta-lactamase superfamily II)/rhodanese-related sulfurtransferase
MIIHQHFVPGIAHSSYIVAGNDACAVIDPERNIRPYLDSAKQMGLKITRILETHLHADFISGHLDLAEATGARIYAPASGNCAFPHEPLKEGDRIKLEDIIFSVIETPGHTPEHISYIAIDTGRADTPVSLFCGDTLFVGDVGRPDLFPGRAEELASSLYSSLHEKILKLPDHCEVYPAHGMGSLCGRAMSAKRTSTIGYEREYNYALQIADRQEFINSLTSDMPAAPDHFARCSEINRLGPSIMRSLKIPRPMDAKSFFNSTKSEKAAILDVRSYPAFSGMHIPGAWHIDLAGSFATQAGWVIPPENDIFLVVESNEQVDEAALQLRRVGLDRVEAFLERGMLAWGVRALPIDSVPIITPQKANDLVVSEKATIIDVRSAEEMTDDCVSGSIHIPWHDLRTRHKELSRDKKYILMCKGGLRASMAASILKMNGINNVFNMAGGFNAYQQLGICTP